MNDVQSLLLQVISEALFNKKAPDIAADQLMPLVNESKAQAVYPLAFSVLDSQLQDKLSPEQYALRDRGDAELCRARRAP